MKTKQSQISDRKWEKQPQQPKTLNYIVCTINLKTMTKCLCCFNRIKGSVKPRKRSPESYNENGSHPPKRPSLQRVATKDRFTKTSTTSSILSVINDDVNAYEFNRRMMGYAIFIINSEFDDQKTPICWSRLQQRVWVVFDARLRNKILKNKTNIDLKESLAGI